MNSKLDLYDLYELLLNYFEDKAKTPTINSKTQDIDCILYDSFVFKCGIEKPRNNFKGGIILGSDYIVTNFFGQKLSLNNDVKSIRKNFEIVDNYCRFRLPEKFLAAYDQAYKKG